MIAGPEKSMSTAKKLALIALGYALAVAGGAAAVAINELLIPADVAETSGGMVAFGDMIVFVLATGFFSLAPTWFLLKLSIEKAPRVLLVALLVIAALGPLSWLSVLSLARPPDLPQAGNQLLGPFIALVAMPRIVAGPVLLVVEGLAFLLVQARVTRALLAAAMLMDLVPLSMFALHMARTIHR
jgi:hypothetical protein